MGETDYNALLYDKMKAEQDKYRDWLLTQPPEEILNHTYEYTMREDIVMCMEELELSPKQAKALLRSPCPLDDVYKEFKDREVEHINRKICSLFRVCISRRKRAKTVKFRLRFPFSLRKIRLSRRFICTWTMIKREGSVPIP